MTTIKIDADKALDLLKQAVEIKGEDYVYEPPTYPLTDVTHGCAYTDPYTLGPSCIVGHALVLAGVPIETMLKVEHWGILEENREDGTVLLVNGGGRVSTYVHSLQVEGGVDITLSPQARYIWQEAQDVQDGGHRGRHLEEHTTWGTALKKAEGVSRGLR